jgi:hypothetical protein
MIAAGSVLAAVGLFFFGLNAFTIWQFQRNHPGAFYDFPCFILPAVLMGIPGLFLVGTALLFEPQRVRKDHRSRMSFRCDHPNRDLRVAELAETASSVNRRRFATRANTDLRNLLIHS